MFKRIISVAATIATAVTLSIAGAIPAQAATLKAPTKVSATAGDEQIVVKWKKATGATGYYAQVTPGDKRCTATAKKTTCTITGLQNGITYKLSLYSTGKKSAKSNAVVKSSLKPASKTITISGTLGGDLSSGKNKKCSDWNLAKSSNSNPLCAVRVVALTASGQMLSSNVEASSTKKFKISSKLSSSQRASITLHLLRADGSYVGPIVLKSDKKRKVAYTSVKASGNANVTLALGKITVKSVDGQSAYAISAAAPKTLNTQSSKTVSLAVQKDKTLAPAGAGRAGFVKMAKAKSAGVSISRAGVIAASDPNLDCIDASAPGGEGIFSSTCYLAILDALNGADPTQIPFTADELAGACSDDVGKTINQIVETDPQACGMYVKQLFSDSQSGNNYDQLTKCAEFGTMNDPNGYISAACYDEANAQLKANSDSVEQYCPAKAQLATVAKKLWVIRFGQDTTFGCLQMFESQFGLGSENIPGPDCTKANPGADSDGDGIPNALDVDDNGDLVIDMADPTNLNGCNIEPAKGVRTSINEPLNYGMVGTGYTVSNLNSAINNYLSGGNFGIAYYAYKSEFFPNAKLVDGTLPAVWITCPGVIWCDPATSRATLGTGVEQLNARFSVVKAAYVASSGKTPARIKYTYTGSVNPVVGGQLQIDGFKHTVFNYANIDVISVDATNKTFQVNVADSYCVYSNGQNAILSVWESCDSKPVVLTASSFPGTPESIAEGEAWATFANRDYAPGVSKTWFNYGNSAPFATWSAKTESGGTKSKWQTSACANNQGIEDKFAAAQKASDDKLALYEAAYDADPESQATNDAWNAYNQAKDAANTFKNDRLLRTPCWSELGGPMQFAADSEQDASCSAMNLNPGYNSEIKSQFALPTEKVNYLWQTKCVGPRFTYSVNAAFISPNVNRLDVNQDANNTNDISAKDALSATDVLRLNYFQQDGTIGSVATTIGSYPITAPLLTKINGTKVDYSKLTEAHAADRTIGTYGNGSADENADYYPHAAVIGQTGNLSVDFIRPQREAFPGENTAITDDKARFHDVYGLSYGIEFEMGATLAGCGANFMASKGANMPVGPSMYDDSATWDTNASGDYGANFLAPMKDAVTDAPEKAPASESLSMNLHIVDCFKQRIGVDKLKDLQLPYGSRTDGQATEWMPSGVGNGDTSCISGMLNARGEAKTGGTDTSGQQFCIQFAPGTLVAANQAGDNVNFLYPEIGWADSASSSGVSTADVHLKNLMNFADSCTFTGTVSPTDGGDQPDSVVWQNNGLHATGLTPDKTYQVEIEANDCISSMPNKVLSSTSIGDFTFTAGQGGGGGDACNDPNGCNGGGGCQQNCGPNYEFGNAYTAGTGFKVYFYGYSPTDGNTWNFGLTKSGGAVSNGVAISQTPRLEDGSTDIYFLEVSGFALDGSDDGDYTITVTAKNSANEDLFAAGNEPKIQIHWPFVNCWGDCSPN